MRRISVLTFSCAVLMAFPSGSGAQGLPSDPEADSPSGVVYEIPVEEGRKDAAPRGGAPQSGTDGQSGGTAGGGGSGASGGSETSIRSENHFGTSSHVPGAPAKAKSGSRKNGAAEKDGDKSSLRAVARSATRPTAASTEGPSGGVVYPLVGVLVLVGAGIGIVAGRRAHGGPRP